MKIAIKTKTFYNLIALFIGILLALAFAEVFFRVAMPQKVYVENMCTSSEVAYEYSPLGWELEPNYNCYKYSTDSFQGFSLIHIKHNSQGFRSDKEFSLESDKKRVLILGDSFMYGSSVDQKETFDQKLEELLPEEYETINFAVVGYGTDQTILKFSGLGVQYNPKIVILGFYQNDFDNNVHSFQHNRHKPFFTLKETGGVELMNFPPKPPDNPPPKEYYDLSWYDKILARSHVYSFFIKEAIATPRFYKIKKILNKFKLKSEKTPFLEANPGSELYMLYKESFFMAEYSSLITLSLFSELNEMAYSEETTLVLLNIPSRFQVDPEHRVKWIEDKFNDVTQDDFDFEKTNKMLKEHLETLDNIIYIDLLPIFKKEFDARKNNFYFEGDDHWNANGIKRASEIVYERLLKKGVLS